ncbi:peptidoglycan-binding protein, partial [Candidatus Gracilibacteria bacterium]|nr:peptidoglycan-binding protein [Candidatus Gracilibacteria bacterium]
ERKGVVGGYPLEFGKYEFPRELQFGSNGEDVGVLQFLLREMGFYAGKTSFYFGNLTIDSLTKFQEKNLIAGSFRAGVFDEITKNKIYELTEINQSRVVYEFRPANPITRAEVAKIVSILLDLKNQGFSLDAKIHESSSQAKPRFDLTKVEFENPLPVSAPVKKQEVLTPNSLFEKLRKIF